MPGRGPTLGEVERRARDVLDGLADRSLPTVDGPGVLGVALVRAEVGRSPSDPPLADVARRLRGGNVHPETGVGNGYIQLDGRRLPNVGVLDSEGVATLREHDFRVVERDATAAYSMAVLVPIGEP